MSLNPVTAEMPAIQQISVSPLKNTLDETTISGDVMNVEMTIETDVHGCCVGTSRAPVLLKRCFQCLASVHGYDDLRFDSRLSQDIVPLLKNVKIGSEDHPTSNSVGAYGPSDGRRETGRGVTLATHLHLVSRLRMSGAVPQFPLYGVHSKKGKVFPLQA